jgi:hypothetical protein
MVEEEVDEVVGPKGRWNGDRTAVRHGHEDTDPTLTLAVYQQVLNMGKGAVELLEQTLGCTLAEARAINNGEARAAEVDEKA